MTHECNPCSSSNSSSLPNLILILHNRRFLIARSRSTERKSRQTLRHMVWHIIFASNIDTRSTGHHATLSTFTHDAGEQARFGSIERGHGHGCHVWWYGSRCGTTGGGAVTMADHAGSAVMLAAMTRETNHARRLRDTCSLSVGDIMMVRSWRRQLEVSTLILCLEIFGVIERVGS